MRPLPILLDHDVHNPVGKLSIIDGEYIAEFAEPIDENLLFPCCYEVLEGTEVDGKSCVTKIKIYELSIGGQ